MVAGVLLVAGLLLLAPAADARPIFASAVHKPPFTGTAILGQLVSTYGCGASASLSTAPAFNLTTGVGVTSGRSSVSGCGLPGFGDNASTLGITGFDSAPFAGKTSYTTATLRFSAHFEFNLSATPANPAGGPFAWAGYRVTSDAYLVDLTTQTVLGGCGGSDYNSTNGSATGVVDGHLHPSGTCYLYAKTNLTNPNQQYYVEFILYAWEWSYAPSGSSTVASARLNLATGGHFFQVTSWSIH